jgi:2-haloacid dehalogenase
VTASIDFGNIRAFTFDCYGTLIDWESGILGTLAPLLRRRGTQSVTDEQILEAYAAAESRIESGPYISYRQVLARVTRELAAQFQTTLAPGDDSLLAASIGEWPAFPDTAALGQLSRRFQLMVLSNIDRDLFEDSRPKLGVDFEQIITAEDVRAYKPAPGHFREALGRTQLAPTEVCHIAQSLYHDIEVARRLGLHTIWINRRRGKRGAGATPQASATPEMEFPDLRTFVEVAVPT